MTKANAKIYTRKFRKVGLHVASIEFTYLRSNVEFIYIRKNNTIKTICSFIYVKNVASRPKYVQFEVKPSTL